MKNIDIRAVLSSLIAYIPVLGIVMLAVALPFRYGWVQRTALYMAGIGYLIDFVYNRRFVGWHWTRDKWVYVLMMLFFLITPVRQLFDPCPPTCYFRGQLEVRTAFFAIGLIGLLGWNNHTNICRYVGYTMLLVSLGIVVYIGALHLSLGDVPGWEHGHRSVFNAIAHQYVGAHMRLDFYFNLAIIFSFYLLHKTHSKWQIVAIVAADMVLIARLLCSDGRSGMLAMLFVVVSGLLFYLCKFASKRMIVLSVLFLVLLGGVAISQNERLDHDRLESEPRLAIWDYALRQIDRHPLVGYGLSSASVQFVENAYQDESMQTYIRFITNTPALSKEQCHSMAVVNPHNLYLQLTLENGIFFPLLFVLICALSIAHCPKSKRLCMALTAFLILWQAVFDSFSPHFLPMLLCLCLWLMMLSDTTTHQSAEMHCLGLSNPFRKKRGESIAKDRDHIESVSSELRQRHGNETITRADSVDR